MQMCGSAAALGAVACDRLLGSAILRGCRASKYFRLKLKRDPTFDIVATLLSYLNSFPRCRTLSPRPQKVRTHCNSDSQQQ